MASCEDRNWVGATLAAIRLSRHGSMASIASGILRWKVGYYGLVLQGYLSRWQVGSGTRGCF